MQTWAQDPRKQNTERYSRNRFLVFTSQDHDDHKELRKKISENMILLWRKFVDVSAVIKSRSYEMEIGYENTQNFLASLLLSSKKFNFVSYHTDFCHRKPFCTKLFCALSAARMWLLRTYRIVNGSHKTRWPYLSLCRPSKVIWHQHPDVESFKLFIKPTRSI